MNSVLEQLGTIKIIPVVVIEDAESAAPLAEALMKGGLPTMEITFRTAAAADAMKRVSKTFPQMILGAGTVLSIGQAATALECGANYIVSPGLNPGVVEYCLTQNVPITPGVLTPTEIESAMEFGLDVVKFFPAEAMGGVEYLKAVSAPYKKMKFIPTGGINESNIGMYLALPYVHACGGSWMVKSDLIANKQFAEITALTHRAKQTIS